MKSDAPISPELLQKYWLVSADMGYGHQRAISPLICLSHSGNIINANKSPEASAKELRLWKEMQGTYEFMSRAGNLPLIGNFITRLLNRLLYIPSYYPLKERSNATLQVMYLKSAIKKGLCDGIIKQISNPELPLITSFYSSAIAAEMAGHKFIYCIICDSDASRAWAPIDPKNSRIKFLLPTEMVRKQFLMYGVKPENIYVTGFPLPNENVGVNKKIALKDLARRIPVLDPKNIYQKHYESLLEGIEKDNTIVADARPVAITYAVGGAGAQKEIGALILEKLTPKIKAGEIKINLVAGSRKDIKEYFEKVIKKLKLNGQKGIEIIYAPDKIEYFKKFNICLRETDILWTKPSELSFYCALGLPIIISTPVGSQEEYNREWLISSGGGIDNLDPRYVDEWLSDLLNSGRLAHAAVDGFLNAEQLGTYNIKKIIL